MEVKIITRHGPSNYGSLLQSLATLRTIESLGHSPEIINYLRSDERGMGGLLTELNAKSRWCNSRIKRAIYIAVRWPIMFLAQHRFDEFRRKYLKLTPELHTHDELATLSADAYITGSDQVWGPIGRDDVDSAYLLDFAKDARRLAYAASFGHTKFGENAQAEFSRLLPLYQHIAVRENTAVEIVEKYTSTHPELVLDPTLLLTPKQWEEYIAPGDRVHKSKYILVYQLHSNSKFDEYAKELSRRSGLPMYRVSPYLHQISRGGKFVYLPTPGKFLALIRDASVMITDSFHGTAFAINFNTQFVEILPDNGTQSRNQSLLSLCGLNHRILQRYDDFMLPLVPIDFAPVNDIIAREREKSIAVLKNMLS